MRVFKERLLRSLIWMSALITIAIMVFIVGYIVYRGAPGISWRFITGRFNPLDESERGIFPMIVTTLYIIGLTLVIAVPVGVLSAIYLAEYAKPGKFLTMIRFTTECLAGIPSIIYGLFGYICFVMYFSLKFSLLSGALTLSIMILPTIVRTTEEAIYAVPAAYKEGSLALGASRLLTLRRILLPGAMPGILTAVILSMGRIISESAAVFLTAGMVYRLPDSIMDSGRTLAVHMYALFSEGFSSDAGACWGTALVLIILVILVNALANLSGRAMGRGAASN